MRAAGGSGASVAAPRPRLLRDVRTWAAAAAVVFLTTAIALSVDWTGSSDRPIDLASLARREALAVPLVRSDSGSLGRGLAAYRDGRYEDAVEELRVASEESDSCEARLYLGSALILLNEDAEARSSLVLARSQCSGSLLHEAIWQLVQLELVRGSPATVIDGMLSGFATTHRADDARELQAALDALRAGSD